MLKEILENSLNLKYILYILSKKIIFWYEGFNYSFHRNGERDLINSLDSAEVKVIFDVGANIGDWTKIALGKFPAAKIHAFEISQSTFKSFQENYGQNKKVLANNYGLSDRCGEFQYKDYGRCSGANSMITDTEFHDHNSKFELLTAKITTGDKYCNEKSIDEIDLLKIDVEGAEHLVLGGFDNLLSKGKIKIIQFEYGYSNGDAKFLMKDFYKFFEDKGYVLGPLKPGGVIFTKFSYSLNDFNSGPNFVAVHKDYKDLIKNIGRNELKGFIKN